MRVLTLVALGAMAAAAPALAGPRDNQFIQDAIKGDNSEVRLGEMAQRRGASPGVRDFGAMLSTDHSQARDQAASVARRMRIDPPDEMAPEAREEAEKLRGLDGRAFDREFARYMVNDHRKDIAKFEREARGGHGPARELARQTLPTLRKHLRVAERLSIR